jgi:hypothetical protein
MNSSKLTTIGLCFVFVMSVNSLRAEVNGLPLFSTTLDPLNSRIEEGWNFLLAGGFSAGNGKGRETFIGTGPWERGWVSRTPWIESGVYYAPSTQWEFGLQVPLYFTATTLNVYYSANDFLKFGIKIGALTSFLATLSAYPSNNWFIALTPSASLLNFGIPQEHTVNSSELFATPVYEKIESARATLNAQLSFGRHLDPLNLGFALNYTYAFGNGLPSTTFVLDDIYLKHLVRASLVLDF